MKPLITFITILTICTHDTSAQNYQCLQAGVKHYFINGNGYLRGIAIDSVKTYTDSVAYYPFHTPRGEYGMGVPPGTDAIKNGSWLGKKVMQLNDGTFIFDNYWSDSVVIKTQANTGDTWTFYSDASSLYYKASVTGTDTMTVLGTLDSVKKILITAQNGSGIVTTDPVDSFQLILSKNNGFVQVFDLYTFPYHKADSAYRTGLDLFLDVTTRNSRPTATTALFNLVDFIIPNDQQLHNWNIGDVFEGMHGTPVGVSMFPVFTYDYIPDTVTGKVVSGHTITYTVTGTHYTCASTATPCALVNNAGVYTFSDNVYPLVDTSYLPEQTINFGTFFLYYFPNDTSSCLVSPVYKTVPYNPPGSFDYINQTTTYKLGIGEIHFYYGDDELNYETDDLIYYKMSGNSCGTFHPLPVTNNGITHLNGLPANISIFPNPATDQLTIKTVPIAIGTPYTISITNPLGQTITTLHSNKQQETINVSNLPAGVYNVSITDESGGRVNEKVVILH